MIWVHLTQVCVYLGVEVMLYIILLCMDMYIVRRTSRFHGIQCTYILLEHTCVLCFLTVGVGTMYMHIKFVYL